MTRVDRAMLCFIAYSLVCLLSVPGALAQEQNGSKPANHFDLLWSGSVSSNQYERYYTGSEGHLADIWWSSSLWARYAFSFPRRISLYLSMHGSYLSRTERLKGGSSIANRDFGISGFMIEMDSRLVGIGTGAALIIQGRTRHGSGTNPIRTKVLPAGRFRFGDENIFYGDFRVLYGPCLDYRMYQGSVGIAAGFRGYGEIRTAISLFGLSLEPMVKIPFRWGRLVVSSYLAVGLEYKDASMYPSPRSNRPDFSSGLGIGCEIDHL
jgi:hypothetical protein